MTVYQNDTYEVVVVGGTYKVVNRDTGVVELDTPILPKAMVTAMDYHDALMKLQAEDKPKEGGAANVVAFGAKGKDRTE